MKILLIVLGSVVLLTVSIYGLFKYWIWDYFIRKEANDDIDTIEEVL